MDNAYIQKGLIFLHTGRVEHFSEPAEGYNKEKRERQRGKGRARAREQHFVWKLPIGYRKKIVGWCCEIDTSQTKIMQAIAGRNN